ncbi:MAG: hypothetical protein AAB613_00335 [Patescibacteria group bacterium]
MRNQTVSIRMATEKQKEGIRGTVNGALGEIFELLTHADAQAIAGAQGEIVTGVRKVFEPFIRTRATSYWLDVMARFTKEVFGLDCDYSNVRVPVSREGFNWMLVADERVTTEMAAKKCAELLPFWRWTNTSLDEVVTHNDRSEKDGTYAIWLHDTVEADEIHKNKSANDIQAAGIKGVTLREQLLLVLWYHWKFGKFLDIVNITLCTGSRYSDGGVPNCYWGPDSREVDVYWYDPGDRDDNLRCREVVSIQ